MASDMANPCAGQNYQTDSRGVVSIHAGEVPFLDPTHAKRAWLEATVRNFGPLFQASAARHRVPVAWLLGLATIETGLWAAQGASVQAQQVSHAGARGVMQVMPQTQALLGRSHEDPFDPAASIDMGAQLVRRLLDLTGADELPEVAAIYNSGKMCVTNPPPNVCPSSIVATNGGGWGLCAAPGYVWTAVAASNTAILSGLDRAPASAGRLLPLVAVAALGGVVWWLREKA